MFSKDFFCQRLRTLRQQKGLLQQELATKFNISKQTYSTWETGTREPNMSALYTIADYFDVSLDYLVGRSDDPKRR